MYVAPEVKILMALANVAATSQSEPEESTSGSWGGGRV